MEIFYTTTSLLIPDWAMAILAISLVVGTVLFIWTANGNFLPLKIGAIVFLIVLNIWTLSTHRQEATFYQVKLTDATYTEIYDDYAIWDVVDEEGHIFTLVDKEFEGWYELE